MIQVVLLLTHQQDFFVEKDLKAPKLKTALASNNLNGDGDKKRIVERCKADNIAKKRTEKMCEGYVGKPKGTYHIAFERSFCNKDFKKEEEKKGAHMDWSCTNTQTK